MTPHAQDDAFREIQLNGKQLVFLFMATTVVSVVIFLCGVLVGRGVRAERSSIVSNAAFGTLAAADAVAPQPASAPTPPLSDPTAAPPPAVDNLSYFNRLEKPNPSTEDLKLTPARETATPPAEKTAPAEPRTAPPPVPKEPSRPPSAEKVSAQPAAQGYAVQVAALNLRSEAEAIAKRLTSKGYVAYVLPPANGTPAVYRVRVGKFSTRHEAETVAAKLQKEEQFRPWITR